MYYTYLDTPIGELLLAGDQRALYELGFPGGPKRRRAELGWERRDTIFAEAKSQISQYFEGTRREFSLSLAPSGTPFQLSVLEELRKIPYGVTVSYRDIAMRLGKPQAMRAVGTANGRNPLPLIIPCHRVIGSNGKLTGFGGGLPTKEALLKLEQRVSKG
ncbi:MAG: methylated-DNA--[protein]-cysteine S-methyltransferase [Ectothiorhodospiraceae bacterium]|nr:methylated-DNA--[protein]-cysteine S-methyltransferase [Ectothiorhodospiraceae bacterium]